MKSSERIHFDSGLVPTRLPQLAASCRFLISMNKYYSGRLSILLLTFLFAHFAEGQGVPANGSGVNDSKLVSMAHLPSVASTFARAFGDRLTKPGSERTILLGTYSTP